MIRWGIVFWGTVLVLLVLFEMGASASPVAPLYIRNLSPLVQVFGLPPAEKGDLAASGKAEVGFVLDVANIFTGDETDREIVRFDGELYRLTAVLRYGLAPKWEVGLDIPYVWHRGGCLDGFIDGFHRTFDMPDGGREEWRADYLRYVSVRDGEVEFLLNRETSGFADLLLTAGYQLYRNQNPALRAVALRAAVELPTGDASRLTGSESTDLSLRLTGTDAATLSAWDMTLYGALGGLWMSRGEVLSERRRDWVGFGTIGMGWSPLDWWDLKVQFDAHTPFYRDSALTQLDAASVQVAVGTSVALPAGFRLDLGVTEDVAVNTAPDVIFHLSLWRSL